MISILAVLASLLLPLLAVGLLAVAITRRSFSGLGWYIFAFIAAIPLSLGIASVVDYAALHIVGQASQSFFWIEGLIFAAIGMGALRLLGKKVDPGRIQHALNYDALTPVLVGIFATCLAVFGLRHIHFVYSYPYGMWDAWAIWNYRAAYLLRAETEWRRAFAPFGDWQHADYPLLLPLQILRGWLAWGGESPVVPEIIASCFGGSILLMLVVCVGLARGWNLGLIGGIIILGQGQLALHTASMYADIPLASLMLSCLLFVYLAFATSRGTEILGLAGVAAGLCAWTKNEGITFCILVTLALTLTITACEGRVAAARKLSRFLAGSLIGLVPLIHLKIRYAPPNDLIVGGGSALSRIFDTSRVTAILASFSAQYKLLFTPLAVLVLLAVVTRHARGISGRFLSFFLIVYLGIMTIFFAVFLTTPHDLSWHLTTAADRLFIQTYPFVYAGVLLLITPLRIFRRGHEL